MNRKRSVNKETKLIRYDIISLSKNIILIHFRYALISLLLKYKIKGYLEVTLTGGRGGGHFHNKKWYRCAAGIAPFF